MLAYLGECVLMTCTTLFLLFFRGLVLLLLIRSLFTCGLWDRNCLICMTGIHLICISKVMFVR